MYTEQSGGRDGFTKRIKQIGRQVAARPLLSIFTAVAFFAVVSLPAIGSADTASTFGEPGSWQSLVRINSGGSAYTDSQGQVWSADKDFSGGSVQSLSSDVADTRDPNLFETERVGGSYSLPIENGSYVLKLYSVVDGAASQKTSNVTVTNDKLSIAPTDVAAIEILQTDANSVYRLNAGGANFTDTRNLTWAADTSTQGAALKTSHDIDGTDNPGLYQDQRVGVSDYKVTVPNGTYVLKLYVAGIGSNVGVFDVYAGSKQVLSNVDPSADGSYSAEVVQASVTVTNGSLDLKFVAQSGETSAAAIELLSPTSSAFSLAGDAKGTVDSVLPKLAKTTTTAVAAAPSGATPSMSGWNLVSSDSFDGSLLSNKWATYEGSGNEGVGTRDPSTVSVSNGELQITDHGSVGGGVSYGYKSTYGRYVITAKDDAGTGYGPAILLWPDSENWPTDGEIDITEMPSGDRSESDFTVHYGADNSQTAASSNGDFTQWHTWTLDWQRDHITLWLDGKLVKTITDSNAIPTTSMHLAIQNDVGASGHFIPARTSSTPADVTLHVASVQVYQQ